MKKHYFLMALLIGFGAKAQVGVSIQEPGVLCQAAGCTDLYAIYPSVYETTSYNVSAIPYNPSFPFEGGIMLDATADDVWSPIVDLPFNFNFYGTNYNTLLVGSNGVINFNVVDASGFCYWEITETIPNENFPIKNAIFGVYQDTNISSPPVTNPAVQNVNYYFLDSGQNAAPNRVFVVNFNQLPQYACNNSVGLQTSQIVLHESTNVIEVFVSNRTSCATWNSGFGLIGVLDATGNSATVPPNRNTGTWNTTNEAWKFAPSGSQIPATITWSQGGSPIGDQNPITVCGEGSYLATVTYGNTTVTDEVFLEAANPPLLNPENLVFCTNDGPPYSFDLTTNEVVVLGAENPQEYFFRYYNTLEDAQNTTPNDIASPANYTVMGNQTIYMTVEDILNSGCVFVKPFNLEINPIPEAPVGNATQTFTPGETLAALEVTGQNIQWYDQSINGNLLPQNTPLVSNTTYYASQTLNGCSGRMSAGRLAVTVTATLGIKQFTASDVVLYPNPASNSLTVSCPQNIAKISVYNTLGQLVLSKNENQKEIKLDISTLNPGTYFIKINSENADKIAKFVKK